ncbi:MAG TPA: tRNA uridine-5-carboxymethylaminomethyl(34) synthesis enzyme MnmG [Candidatus Faecimonas gallistercoris]|nr:tRNA uridine-5-carboxymethylaminomethyl(34) synthesis enzyme MnmG [Candidatus Faecimonas gallistercoris]
MKYEIIVVGGGHAGCEAALSSARLGHKTLLVTSNINNIADMPCNPSIGGPAKGIVVREIDALGGEMGKNADKAALQTKMLNTKKGPAVQALRFQADKIIYPKEMLKTLNSTQNLEIKEAMVEKLLVKDKKIEGVELEDGEKILASAVILTTGTYLKAVVLKGATRKSSGPHGEKESKYLSDSLKELGFTIKRLKTGTPQRIDKNSIDYSKTQEEKGDSVTHTFSFDNIIYRQPEDQISCHLIYTTEKTHEIIKEHLKESSMYGGYVEGIGPRYCPSIEDKVVRFSDKERHQLFLEPESLYYDDIYIQGFSTSMPEQIQDLMVHSLPGLEHAKILKYGYAIEYDAIDSKQLQRTLETKIVENLYTAGQINGTSGYEEAAGQGLIAGINASLKLEGREPLILKRNESYIGVLIDDLVTKGVKDPYRLLTSRAEYRLLLRNDNADLRLRDYGYQVGLINEEKYKEFYKKKENIKELEELLKSTRITPKKEINEYIETIPSTPLKDGISLYDFLKRPEITLENIKHFIELDYTKEELEQVEINAKYEGYIKKANKEAAKMLSLEEKKIPEDINYDKIPNLASEARQKLREVRPTTIGQASRISGVNPADISILMVYLRRNA